MMYPYLAPLGALLAIGPLLALAEAAADTSWEAPGMGNPIIPGYFADPDFLEFEGRYYLYATVEPWGGERLACWVSDDFRDWEYHELNWPTKAECSTPKSGDAMVWAPGVVRGKNGKFYLYVSVGSEIWVGEAERPLGPWRNALGDRPLIPFDFRDGYHMIDADAFIDEDGSAYLYWGSGWNWTNGKCFAARLGEDMTSFVGEVRDVTPANYFEAPLMIRRSDRYYLMYSEGITLKDTYEIRYAVGDSPFGPFAEAGNSPLLSTDHEAGIVSPGHHTVAEVDGASYLVYHRNSLPYVEGQPDRRICVDAISMGDSGEIVLEGPTHRAPERAQRLADSDRRDSLLKASASSSASPAHGPECLLDDNYATLWRPEAEDRKPWVELDLGAARPEGVAELRFEYPGKSYTFTIFASGDGAAWEEIGRSLGTEMVGSPYRIELPDTARYLRLAFEAPSAEEPIGLWEWDLR